MAVWSWVLRLSCYDMLLVVCLADGTCILRLIWSSRRVQSQTIDRVFVHSDINILIGVLTLPGLLNGGLHQQHPPPLPPPLALSQQQP
jgi:hypothetical protein